MRWRIRKTVFNLAVPIILTGMSAHAVDLDTKPLWKNEKPDWTSRIQLADLDNDGYPELTTANIIRGEGYTKNNKADIKVYKNIGGNFEGTASQVIKMKENVGSWNIAMGDYDNDGDLDLAVGNVFEKRDLIFKNDGGFFDHNPAWESDDASVSHGLDWVDYDQDGDLDLSVAAAYSGVKIYENMDGKVSARAKWESYEALDFQDVDWTDMDNDGDFDLAVSNHNDRPPGGIYVFKSSNGKLPEHRSFVPDKAKQYLPMLGIFLTKTASWQTHSIKYPGRLAWGDIDGDGFPELAATNGNGPVTVFGNTGGNLQQAPLWQTSDGESSFDLTLADVDNDGLVKDTVFFSGEKVKKVVYLDHRPVQSVNAVFVDSRQIALEDYCFNLKDGWISLRQSILKTAKEVRIDYVYSTGLDLVVAKSTWVGNPDEGKTDKIYFNRNGALNPAAEWQTEMKTLSNAVAVGDVDNDGDQDVLFGGMVGWESRTKVPQHIYLYRNHTIK